MLALSGTYEQLFTYVMFASILFSVAARPRAVPPPPHAPGPSAPLSRLGLSGRAAALHPGSVAFVLNTLLERPTESLAGLGLLGSHWYCEDDDPVP